jgi:hypothetical protein
VFHACTRLLKTITKHRRNNQSARDVDLRGVIFTPFPNINYSMVIIIATIIIYKATNSRKRSQSIVDDNDKTRILSPGRFGNFVPTTWVRLGLSRLEVNRA